MDNNTICIGVMGYSGQKFDIEKARVMLNQAFDLFAFQHKGSQFAIVSGYTNLGIPAIAYEIAVERGWTTVGVACAKAKEYDVFPCDEVCIVGENWGDESPTFLNMCQVFVRIGGGKQSRREIAQAKADGKFVYEFDLEALPA
ncbi:MAG: hypothetical protein UX08_C0008G0002 [Candidatus Collierbacteria bacterium GW2011_GWB1_45_35]|uniref:Uncharacterized protein n=1 Tax=Candidatus Collierbacteria bacterium GW2011_GWB2_45_17 TaxID=1618388 RepID=A0A837IP20_9BACT|nr:MAG: hypothetical protein UW48_C0011G0002 [Microgenomates group bacterium GW2011_GWC1_44_23]KKT95070.1 MAG: hypothetical protein UW96_C0011G0016 [Candidatus Collierbacteria bacterium GW2011_GWA1_45_15]KKT99156.1 MAG: hypothetical protein UX01_C0012G0002 [Candidatus Collierbacteria bacterium GW2011_GWB2_45_17]KKU05275.1 MAG: hypothetical protein UX08_C0008G0002 [Candidatus Collierbacteria bacterium GW2011_GWB1_45_35]KKU07695.1 MAG: hypothetical protein UX11_C0011G0002 [Candidatus Collierbacte